MPPNGSAPEILTFRPRKGERDIIEWAQRYKRMGRLREAVAEAIRLHIALEQGRINPPEQAPKPQPLDERSLRRAMLSLVPELAAQVAPLIVARLPGLADAEIPGPVEDPEADTLKRNFTDERMFADYDDDDED